MKFKPIKRFADATIEKTIEWIRTELNACLRELFIGLYNLTFQDNFNSFTWTGALTTGQELQIPHTFKKIPSGYIIYKQVGNGVVDAGTTAWTNEVVYLRNNGAVTVTLTVVFFL